jgi:hypothetical protein
MQFTQQPSVSLVPLGSISERYLQGEQTLVSQLTEVADVGQEARESIRKTASELVTLVRKHAANEGGLDAFLQQYDLSSEEGVLLMCIAEALLRIPDADTAENHHDADQRRSEHTTRLEPLHPFIVALRTSAGIRHQLPQAGSVACYRSAKPFNHVAGIRNDSETAFPPFSSHSAQMTLFANPIRGPIPGLD